MAYYGKGEDFELKTQYLKFENRIDYEYFAKAYKRGGVEEVSALIALKDSFNINYPYILKSMEEGYSINRYFYHLYEEGGLSNVQQFYEKAKVEYLKGEAEAERVKKEQERLAQEYAANAERIQKKAKRFANISTTLLGVGIVSCVVIGEIKMEESNL